MGGQYKWLDRSPEEILQTIESPIGKRLAQAIFDAFHAHNLTYKVRTQAKYKNAPDGIGYTVHFYIWKSKESIIMNTNPFKVQLRIHD